MVKKCFIALGMLLACVYVYGQQGTGYAREKWKVADPFEQKVFVENNEGQFEGKTGIKDDKVLYSTRITGVEVYFTTTGIVYRYDKYPAPKWGKEEEEEEHKASPPQTYTFREQWVGANEAVTVYPEEEVSFYYCYPKGNKHTTIAHAFKKLVYKNIYPGIDIEYSFKEEKKGIEYRIIVHPGGDLSRVKISYPDGEGMVKTRKGDIEIKSSMGVFADEAPGKTYYEETGKDIRVTYECKGTEEGFSTASYDHSKTLVIDPFKTNPAFTGYNAGYDVNYDLNGNVYAYGSFLPFQEVKISNTGSILWTFNAVFPVASGQYADFAVDEVSGTSYLSNAGDPVILKVNTLGKQVDSMDVSTQMNELWRMAYNRCENQIIIGGGGTAGNYQLATLDTSLLTFNPVNVLGTSGGHHDVSLLCIDNTNGYCFMATAQSNVWSNWNNTLVKCPIPTFLPMVFSMFDGYTFYEGPTVNYVDGVAGHTCAMNGIVASPNRVCMYDGFEIRRANKNTGALIDSVKVSKKQLNWGGIDVDICDNIYVGNDTLINVYDSSLALAGTIHPGYQVYDLRIMPNNQLCACGKGFVSAYTITTNTMSISKTKTNAACGKTNGTALAKLTGCGSDSSQYNYLWSNGATTQQDTGLAPGTYTVTISSGCDFKFTDTVTILGNSAGGMSLTISQKNVSCNGDSNGSATVTVTGGKGPYTYDWTPGNGTNATISNLKAGTYNITVSDSAGCNSAVVVIMQPKKLTDSIVSNTPVPCTGGNNGAATVIAKGGVGAYTYVWAPSGGTGTTATGLSAGVYTVTVKDSNGCSAIVTDTIKQLAKPKPVITGSDSVCQGSPATLTAIGGGTSYLWSNGATTSSITVTVTATATYSVQVTTGGCTGDTTFKVIAIALPSITVTSNKSICLGQSALLSASGGTSYFWSPGGSTSSSVSVTPSSTTTYTVTVSNGICVKDTTVTVTVNTINPTITPPQKVCQGDSATLCATGGGSYLWSTGATASCINVKKSGNYTVIVNNGCIDSAKTTLTVDIPTLNACCNTTIAPGQSDTLYATGQSNYSWSPATGLSCTTCPNPIATPTTTTTYTVTSLDSAGCPIERTVTIFIEISCSDFIVPNIFTPNDDGRNDDFVINVLNSSSYSINIYDRWGVLVYTSNNPDIYWNGNIKNGNYQAPTGVYYYIIKATCQDNTYDKRGFVHLIR